MLQCNVRGVTKGYPLIIEIDEVDGAIEEIATDYAFALKISKKV